ncbi:MAG: metalloregulator ArsR/SmtB family transcription factor [Pseudomonadota bacterium]
MTPVHTIAVDHVFAAIADPTRRQLLEKLSNRGAVSASSLSADMPISRQAIAKHLGILCEAGLATRHRAGKQVVFQAEPAQLAATGRWLQRMATRWEQAGLTIEQTSVAATTTTSE